MDRAGRQRRYKQRRAAGLAMLPVAIPAELKAKLEARGLADSPEVEDLVTAVLTAMVADEGDASPEPRKPG